MKHLKTFENFNHLSINEEEELFKKLWDFLSNKFSSLKKLFTGDIQKGISASESYFQKNPDKVESIINEIKKLSPKFLQKISNWYKNLTESSAKELEVSLASSAKNRAKLYENVEEDKQEIGKATKFIFGEDFSFGSLIVGVIGTIAATIVGSGILVLVGIIIGIFGLFNLIIREKELASKSDDDFYSTDF